MDYDSVVKLLIALLLVLLNGFFVAADFPSLRFVILRFKLRLPRKQNGETSRTHHQTFRCYLSATQLGITLASLALGWVGESALEHVFHGVFSYFNINIAPTMITTISVVTSF